MIQYPEMRAEIVEALKAFADPRYQQAMWVDNIGKDPNIAENLQTNVDILYNNSDVAEDPFGHIGATLRNAQEARAIEEFDKALDSFSESATPGINDATAIAMPKWQGVVNAAKEALKIFSADES